MKKVSFELFGHGNTKKEAVQKVESLVDELSSRCRDAEMKLTNTHIIPAMNGSVSFRDDGREPEWVARYSLMIEKGTHTYNQIYKLVNDIQVCRFTIIDE